MRLQMHIVYKQIKQKNVDNMKDQAGGVRDVGQESKVQSVI